MDILQKTHHAMAALTTSSIPAPVAFSPSTFLYPFSLLMKAIGTGRLMPTSDVDSLVINVKSGYARRNRSFILGRLLRDWPLELKAGDGVHGLYITVVDAVEAPKGGHGSFNILSLLSYLTITIQFLIAITSSSPSSSTLPALTFGTLATTVISTLPQWSTEKFACRKDSKHTYALTTGNGASHVLLIRSNGLGYNLEDMAAGRVPFTSTLTSTLLYIGLAASCVLSVLSLVGWVILGKSEERGGVLAILLLGLVQNIMAAGFRQDPKKLGFWLDVKGAKTVWAEKVAEALRLAEGEVKGAKGALEGVFFPGGMNGRDDSKLQESLL